MPFTTVAVSQPIVAPPLPGSYRACLWTQYIAVGIGLFIGGSNLLCWIFQTAPFEGFLVMRINTAIGICAASLSLAFWLGAKPRGFRARVAQGLGAVTALIGGLTTGQYLSGVDLGIDQLLVPGAFPGDTAAVFTVNPGRMSLNAALSELFLGLALIGLEWRVPVRAIRFHLSAPFALLGAMPCVLGLVGYVQGVGTFTGMLRSTNILLHTACALLALSIGVLAARPERPPLSRLLSTGADGLLLRWTLPGTLGLLLLLAWLVGRGRVAGMVAPGEGAALMLYGGMVLLTAMLISASLAIGRQESKARQAAEAFRLGQERSRAIVDTALDGVIVVNDAGLIVAWNPSAERIFGWRRDEVTGVSLADCIVPQPYRSAYLRGLARYLDTGETALLGRRLEVQALRRNGEEFPIELSISRLPGTDAPLFVGFLRDIADRKASEQELRSAKEAAEAASHAKDNFMATLSHELRTPLAPVLLSAASMREDTRLPADAREDLAMIQRNIALEARLIDDLLDLTRIARGKLALRVEQCDAHSLVAHAVEIVREEARNKQIAIETKLIAEHSNLQADPARLQQVFWNILKNAVKFTPPGGSVTITTREDISRDRFILDVTDTGIGFASEVSQRMFEPFEQAGREGDHRFGGLGLGLAIARAIVDMHGGTILAASAGSGHGARFTVELPGPVVSVAGVLDSSEMLSDGGGEIQPLHILVVEDHDPTLAILTRLLERAGHHVVPAATVAAGLAAKSRDGRFDVLISDLGLPDGTGLDLMATLRNREPRLIGIALSGYGTEEDLRRTRDAGFAAHLVKPVDFDQLHSALQELYFSNRQGKENT
jgi:PAS domain S-box-containing protein